MARVVVIDDNPEMLDLLSKILTRAGYEVATASDGAVGEELVETKRTDLVITDIIMPNREGLETIFNLRKTRPELPIIAISGGGRVRDLDLLDLAKRLGAGRVLEKPLDRKVLLRTVAELIGRGFSPPASAGVVEEP